MALPNDKSIVHWKKLWQQISGIHYNFPKDAVKETLLNVSKEIQDGILQYKKSKNQSDKLENILKSQGQEKWFLFTNKLQQFLDLESQQCWDILCAYLVKEYRGSVHSLSTFISSEANMTKLLNDIWGYYTLERMIALKVVKNLLKFSRVSEHPYHAEYSFVLEKVTLQKLRQSYIKQFEYLIKEDNPPSKLVSGEFFNYQTQLVAWSERKLREMNEILHILILIVHRDGVDPNELKTLLDCFKLHSFGKQQRYLDANNSAHNDLIVKITFSEVALFLRCLDVTDSQLEDPNWYSSISKFLCKDMLQLCHYPEHGPLLLAWMLINIRTLQNSEDDELVNKYKQFGTRALQLNVFGYLHKIVSHSMFKDQSLTSKVVKKSIYDHLSFLCDLFDGDGSVAQCSYIYDLLSELLTWPSIAKEFCEKEEGGVRSLYNTALENFPFEFISLSKIAYALSIAGESQNKYIKKQLENLPVYSEVYDSVKYPLKLSSDDEYILLEEYSPFRGIDYKIPKHTVAILIDRKDSTTIHFRTKINYFDVLRNEINCLLAEAMRYTEIDENRLQRISCGIKYLCFVIQKLKSPEEITNEMVHPTELVIDVLNRLKILQRPPIELLANCLNVCTALLPLFEEEVFTRVINLNILPVVTSDNLDFKKYAYGTQFDSSLVGAYLVNFEKNLEKYKFLLAYLKFLKRYALLSKNHIFKMELPGLIFLLREIFPHVHLWRFESQSEKFEIYSIVMQYFIDMLKMNGDKAILRDICIYSLLNLDNGIILLKFVGMGNAFLQAIMENETDWMSDSPTDFNYLVELSLTILMKVLRLKSTILENVEFSPLESIIYTEPKKRDTLRIIPVVTSYMNNIFNRRLPILSCRLLRRFAIEFKMSLLGCLDMEPDQLRLTFLQRLEDELEYDDLKIAVLEFVEACIHKQPCLTEAFFKIKYDKDKIFLSKKKADSNTTEGILVYMADYLQTVLIDPKFGESPLLSRIMSLFHALWKNNMQTLVEELMVKPSFWPSLCKPLFGAVEEKVKAYSQLFNIVGIELFYCINKESENTELKKTVNKFLSSECLERWVTNIFEFNTEFTEDTIKEEAPEWLCRLQSFKDLMILLLRKEIKGIVFPEKSRKLLAKYCLQSAVDRLEIVDDLRPFIIVSELFLITTLDFKYTDNPDEEKESLQQIIKLLSSVSIYYEDIHVRSRESSLAIAIKSVDYFQDELKNDSSSALKFLESVVNILCLELNQLEVPKKYETHQKVSNMKSLILSLNLLKILATILQNNGSINLCTPFITNKVIHRLLSCANRILQVSTKHKVAVELLDVLIIFAKENCSDEFLHCDIGYYLWLKLLPPKELLEAPFLTQPERENPWLAQNWWPIYARGIELVTVLLRSHKHFFLKEVFSFVGVHEEFLVDSILLSKQSLEPKVMALIKSTVQLILELVIYEKEWRLEHIRSLYSLMRCIQKLMHNAISLLHRPKILSRLICGTSSKAANLLDPLGFVASDELVKTMNDLVEIITFSAKALLRFSPTLLELIAEPEFCPCKWEPLIEIEFGAPKLDAGNYSQLTFGIVLSVISIMTKALTLHEIPFNVLSSDENVSSSCALPLGLRTPPKASTTVTFHTSPRSPYPRSLSSTSTNVLVLSSTPPSNEILTNLDGQLCLICLEHVLTLLASQSMLALKNTNLSNREKQLIRREISTELTIYHDFIRKRILHECKDIWHRRKHGQVMMKEDDPNSNSDTVMRPSTSSGKSSDHKNSMRVETMRRLHTRNVQKFASTPISILSKNKSYDIPLDISTIISDEQIGQSPEMPVTSTPNTARRSELKKRVAFEDTGTKVICYDEDVVNYFEPEEPNYSPFSTVNFVEEDYLHFLSNLLTVICHSD